MSFLAFWVYHAFIGVGFLLLSLSALLYSYRKESVCFVCQKFSFFKGRWGLIWIEKSGQISKNTALILRHGFLAAKANYRIYYVSSQRIAILLSAVRCGTLIEKSTGTESQSDTQDH